MAADPGAHRSLSVNAHGRYAGVGPLVQSVKSLAVVLADGSLVEASPVQNADIFYGVIPRAGEGFSLKRRLDPTNRFRNQLWHKYYQTTG